MAIASNFWNWLYKLNHKKPVFKALLYKSALQEILDAIALSLFSLFTQREDGLIC
jgi:hypothetical protein